VSDQTGRLQQVGKSHVVRNTEKLVEELAALIRAGQDHCLEAIGMAPEPASEELACFKEIASGVATIPVRSAIFYRFLEQSPDHFAQESVDSIDDVWLYDDPMDGRVIGFEPVGLAADEGARGAPHAGFGFFEGDLALQDGHAFSIADAGHGGEIGGVALFQEAAHFVQQAGGEHSFDASVHTGVEFGAGAGQADGDGVVGGVGLSALSGKGPAGGEDHFQGTNDSTKVARVDGLRSGGIEPAKFFV